MECSSSIEVIHSNGLQQLWQKAYISATWGCMRRERGEKNEKKREGVTKVTLCLGRLVTLRFLNDTEVTGGNNRLNSLSRFV